MLLPLHHILGLQHASFPGKDRSLPVSHGSCLGPCGDSYPAASQSDALLDKSLWCLSAGQLTCTTPGTVGGACAVYALGAWLHVGFSHSLLVGGRFSCHRAVLPGAALASCHGWLAELSCDLPKERP